MLCTHRPLYEMPQACRLGSAGYQIRRAKQRVDTAIERIKAYLDGRCGAIKELMERRLSFNNTNIIPEYPNYAKLCSGSRIAQCI